MSSHADTKRRLLAELVQTCAQGGGDAEAVYTNVTARAAELLDVERAGVWLFDEARTRLECVHLFERSRRRHGRGPAIAAVAAPAYFAALAEERCVAAVDAQRDRRT